jgi:Transmembrane domain of unknown function (DUF3566)
VDEAGRAPEPPLIVAPPGLDIDPEVKVPDAVTENEVMSEDAITSNGASSHHNGGAADDSSRRVPFPADEIGKKKGPAHLVTESDAGSNGSVAEPKDSDGHSDGLVSTASGVLDSGRQAVKQAMAATTNWFSPSAKSDASDPDQAGTTGSSAPRHASPAVPGGSIMAPPPPSSGSGAPGPSVFSPGERRPTFTASSTATSSGTASSGTASSTAPSSRDSRDTATSPASAAPPAPSTSSPQTGPGGASSLWREVRPHPGPPPAPASFSAAATGTRPGGPGTPPSTPGVGPSGPGPGTPRPSGPRASSPGGQGFSAAGAASAVGGAAAGLASSVTSAFQGRNAGGKRKRRASVRRSSKRQAQLTLSRVEPWSVMKFSFVVSVVAFIILFVAVAVLYMVLSALGVFTSLQHTVNTITSSQGSPGTNISNWFSMSRILGYTGMLGALNIVLITAMSTIGAVVYNLIASTIGGVEVTLRETD